MSNRRLSSKTFVNCLILALLVLLLAACSQTTSTDDTPEAPAVAQPTSAPAEQPTEAPAEQPTEAPVEEPTAEEMMGPQMGGVLRIGILQDAASLGDPPALRSFQDFILMNTSVESLGRYDTGGRIVPWLAEEFTEDPDALTLTIRLKQGIRFHDGTDFNAEAVKWNLDRFAEAGRSEFGGISSIDVIDEYTVQITLESWDNTVSVGAGYFAGPMVSPTAFEANGADWAKLNPVGTGPFKLVNWERDSKQVYERNEDYWQEGLPYLDGVEWHIIADPVTAMASFQTGELDAFIAVPGQNAADIEAAGGMILTLETGIGAAMNGVVGDSGHPDSPFADVKVRQALGHAIDQEAIVDAIQSGYGTVVNQWAREDSWAYNPDVVGYPYDPDRARELLTEAGYPDGFETTIWANNRGTGPQLATAIQGFLADVGITANLEVVDFSVYNEHVVGGTWDGIIMFSSRVEADAALTMPRVLSANGLLFAKGIAHPDDMEALFATVRSEPDFDAKLGMVHELQRLAFDEYAFINPIAISENLAAKYPYVHDDGINITHGSNWTPETAWLDK